MGGFSFQGSGLRLGCVGTESSGLRLGGVDTEGVGDRLQGKDAALCNGVLAPPSVPVQVSVVSPHSLVFLSLNRR